MEAHIGLSIGIALSAAGRQRSAELLVTRSDAALYHSKKMGRNRFTCYGDMAGRGQTIRTIFQPRHGRPPRFSRPPLSVRQAAKTRPVSRSGLRGNVLDRIALTRAGAPSVRAW